MRRLLGNGERSEWSIRWNIRFVMYFSVAFLIRWVLSGRFRLISVNGFRRLSCNGSDGSGIFIMYQGVSGVGVRMFLWRFEFRRRLFQDFSLFLSAWSVSQKGFPFRFIGSTTVSYRVTHIEGVLSRTTICIYCQVPLNAHKLDC